MQSTILSSSLPWYFFQDDQRYWLWNATYSTPSSTPTTLPTLQQHPPHSNWCVTHASPPTTYPMLTHHPRHPCCHPTQTSTPPMLPQIARHIWNSNVVCQVISAVFYFMSFSVFYFLIFSDVLSCLSYLLQKCSKNVISIWNFQLFFGKLPVVIRKSQVAMFQYPAWGLPATF